MIPALDFSVIMHGLTTSLGEKVTFSDFWKNLVALCKNVFFTGRCMSEYRTYFAGPNFFKKHVTISVFSSFVKFQAAFRLPVWKQPMGTLTSSFFHVLKTPTKINMYVRIPVSKILFYFKTRNAKKLKLFLEIETSKTNKIPLDLVHTYILCTHCTTKYQC